MQHLLAFGTEHYRDNADRLKAVPNELKKIVGLFTGFGYTEQLARLRHDPSTDDLERELDKWLSDDGRSREDVAIIYYTGHGFTRGGLHYIAAANTQPDLIKTALRSDVFIELIGPEPRVGSVLLILDVCFSGRPAHSTWLRLGTVWRLIACPANRARGYG